MFDGNDSANSSLLRSSAMQTGIGVPLRDCRDYCGGATPVFFSVRQMLEVGKMPLNGRTDWLTGHN